MGTISNSSSLDIRIAMSAPQKEINLLRGWPAASLLPAHLMARGAERILSDPAVYTPAMQYGPSGGYPLLRSSLTQWLARHYRVKPDTERLAITGGASQSIANVLLSFTDPVITRAVWFVAPTYHLASNIFEDAGFKHRLRATPEDEDGVNLEILENKILALEEEEKHLPKSKACAVPCRHMYTLSSLTM